jgi:hypothetical protein
MECEFNRTPYKRRLDNYSRHEHLAASMQPRENSEDTFKIEFGRTQRRLQKYSKPTVLDYEELGGLVIPRHMRLRIWPTSYWIRGGTWPMPYTSCNYS